MTDRTPHYATRDFHDAGTEKAFERGQPIEASDGEIANYAAAGLASTDKPKAVPAEADDKPAAKKTAA